MSELIDSVRGGTVVLHIPEIVAKVDGDLASTEKTGLRTMLLWPWLLGAGLVVLVIDLAVGEKDGETEMTDSARYVKIAEWSEEDKPLRAMSRAHRAMLPRCGPIRSLPGTGPDR